MDGPWQIECSNLVEVRWAWYYMKSCNHVPSQLSSQWLFGNPCHWKYDVKLHIAATILVPVIRNHMPNCMSEWVAKSPLWWQQEGALLWWFIYIYIYSYLSILLPHFLKIWAFHVTWFTAATYDTLISLNLLKRGE